MSVFAHYVARASIRHQDVVRAAKSLPQSALTGRTAGEQEVSRLSILLIRHLHVLSDVASEIGADALFAEPDAPIPPEAVDALLALRPK